MTAAARMIEIAAKVVPFGLKAKAELIQQGRVAGEKACPECGGTVRLSLAGARRQLRMACTTEGCCMRMME